MKKLLSALVLLALVSSVASANVPDPDFCIVEPADLMIEPRLICVPDDAGNVYADLHIVVKGDAVMPLGDKFVEVWLNPDCTNLFMCDDLVLTGTTDSSTGVLDLNLNMGGCCSMTSAAIIIADGVPIRAYDIIASTDNNGGLGDGSTGLTDFVTFGQTWGPGCTDLDGSSDANIPDFVAFGAAYTLYCAPYTP